MSSCRASEASTNHQTNSNMKPNIVFGKIRRIHELGTDCISEAKLSFQNFPQNWFPGKQPGEKCTGSVGADEKASRTRRYLEVEVQEQRWLTFVSELQTADSDIVAAVALDRHFRLWANSRQHDIKRFVVGDRASTTRSRL